MMEIGHMHTVFTWRELCVNAETLFLDPAEFQKLEPFFAALDHDFFRECAAHTLKEFPMEKARRNFSEPELRKLLLLCIVANYGNMVELYRSRSYPQAMLDEIRRDLRLWLDTLARDFEGYGLTERIFSWEQDCLKGVVKQFGRLQANDVHGFFPELSLYRTADKLTVRPAFIRGNPPHPALTQLDKTVNIHIPASGPLPRAACIDSFRQMRQFMTEFHPDYDWKAFVCYSWMLDAQFQQILNPASNILEFQRFGHLFDMPGSDETSEIIWRIWGMPGREMPVGKLPERSAMERGVKRFLQNGGRFREGVMVIFRDEVESLCGS